MEYNTQNRTQLLNYLNRLKKSLFAANLGMFPPKIPIDIRPLQKLSVEQYLNDFLQNPAAFPNLLTYFHSCEQLAQGKDLHGKTPRQQYASPQTQSN